MNVAIIPARGGSKRIPRKNIKEFCGKPMIVWSIEAAKRVGIFDKIIVSTDDAEIREIALSHGVEVPFERPQHLANDYAGTLEVICHALQWLAAEGVEASHACCIYATAPFVQDQSLREAYELLKQCDKTEFVLPVTEFDYPIFRGLKLDRENNLSMLWPEHEKTRSQDLESAYHDAGQFYWGTAKAWLENENIYSSETRGVTLPTHLVQDIDTPEDWKSAELKFRALLDETI